MDCTKISLTFEYKKERFNNDVYDLWRLTQNKGVISDVGDVRRINNRSWRLISKRILLKDENIRFAVQDLASDHLPSIKSKEAVDLQRPCPVQSDSRCTLFSHTSDFRLGYKHGELESDLSDFFDEESTDEDSLDAYEDQDSIHSEPRLRDNNHHEKEVFQPKPQSQSTECPENNKTKPMFSNISTEELNDVLQSTENTETSNNHNKNIFFIGNSVSPSSEKKPDLNNNASPKLNGSSEPKIVPGNIVRQDSLFGNFHYTNMGYRGSNSSSSTDISEDDESIAEDDEFHREKGLACRGNGSKNDDDSEWLSFSSDDEKSEMKEPALTFNKTNLFVKRKHQPATDIQNHTETSTLVSETKPRSRLSTLFLNEFAHNEVSQRDSKPVLKRSSTTGVITVNQRPFRGKHHGEDVVKSQSKPSILFSKRYASLTDISKNYPHYKNELVQSSILNESFERYDHENPITNSQESIVKQQSIVGISDFNVISRLFDIKRPESSKNLEKTNGNKLGMNNDPLSLSSSLNKYSTCLSNNSIKGLLSKSSLSINNLLQSKRRTINNKAVPSDPKISKSDNLNLYLSNRDSSCSSKSSSVSSSQRNIPGGSSLPRQSESPFDEPMHSGDSSTSNIKYIRLSPNSTRRSMLSTELSESLKESIKRDFKLGKVPLPTRIIKNSNDATPSASDDLLHDDYHSKGW